MDRTGTPARLMLAALLVTAPAAIADHHEAKALLAAGSWGGFYQPFGGEPIEAIFAVRGDEESRSGWAITIQLDFEPREDYEFPAKDLRVNEERVKFRFGRPERRIDCRLVPKDDGELGGDCTSGEGDAKEIHTIHMTPPEPEAD